MSKRSICAVAALVFICGCAHNPPADEIQLSLKRKKSVDEQDISRVEEVVKQIKERNNGVEKSSEWLKKAYSSLMIKKLNDIPQDEYSKYNKYVDNGMVYIIVHPAYYAFFNNDLILSSSRDAEVFPSENIVERLYKKISLFDQPMKILQEQERILRDFLEFMSTEKKLIILILPRYYTPYLRYGYIKGLDEYARYINEVSNESDSVIYVESLENNTGKMTPGDHEILISFLNKAGVNTIMMGGGYVGQCLQEFYLDVKEEFGYENIYLVPELSAVSPENLDNEWGNRLLTSSGRLNIKAATNNLKKYNAYKKQKIRPKVKNLPFLFYEKKAS